MDGAQARNGPSVDGGAGPSTSYSTADNDDNGGAGGAKVWVLVLLFSLLVLLFLPSAVRRGGTSGGGGFQRGGITLKSGWDVVNLCLVLFAILCGLLGRGGGDGDGDGESASAAAAAAAKSRREVSPAMAEPEPIAEASTEDVWERLNSSYDSNQSAHTTAGIRRMKSSSSYPELRLGSDGVWGLESPELAWRPYDDAELYRPRRDDWPDRNRGDADRPRLRRTSSDVNAIPVDKYEVRAPPQDERRRRRSVEKPQKMAKVVEEERTVETLAARPARSRTWSPEELNATLSEADKYEVPTPLGARRPRRSAEKLPKMPAVVEDEHPSAETLAARPSRSRTWSPEELNATLSELASAAPPAVTPRPRHRRHSVESLPTMEEVEKEIIVEEINNPLPSSTGLFPPGTPPPPPPPPPPPATMSRSKKKRSGSVGGAKELASAIALFYQKKRKSIIMKRERHHHHHHHLSDDHYSSPSSESSASPEATTRTNPPPRPPPPPPPPPPPSSIFSNLFKKGGNKSRRIHSLAPPRPPPPPPPTHRSRKPPQPPSRLVPTPPPPAPVRTRPPRAHAHAYAHPQRPPHAQGYPQQPPLYHMPRGVVYHSYRLPPPSPPMPPPPPPPPMSEGEEEVPSVTASPAPSYCASPDVNTKADNFIERFRAGLKLEKINSYREKLQIQEGATVTMAEEDGEFMVIGSLFEDDGDMSLPGTPATAAAAAVAVGY
ncbi:serine/arginine repetitive matrix protein 1-like [Lolium rigidum]|uniref:serine/arginine repetitive matrix protein 1-like n=1 Tax=Lolium rigidum TaxID=89674 RepID=UPI001F5C53BB|nr:serine/arginine repetitive matrix protein 1-like [Lolium rigidum]